MTLRPEAPVCLGHLRPSSVDSSLQPASLVVSWVRWYICCTCVCLIPIILRFIELFLFRDIGSNFVTVVSCCGQLVDYLCFHLHSSSFFRAKSFFVWEGEYLCFANCFVITLTNLYLLTDVISVRLDTHFFSSRFLISPYGWTVRQFLPSLATFW